MYTGIIHTMAIYAQVSQEQIEDILYCQNLKTNNSKKISIEGTGFEITIIKKTGWLFMFIDTIEFLGSPIISDKDLSSLEDKIMLIFKTLGIDSCEPMLKRIDFRLDIKLSDEDRRLYFRLLEKTQTKRGWLCKINANLYKKSSVYYKSKSRTSSSVKLNIYDKEQERKDTGNTPSEYEEDVVRVEVQVENRHLRYQNSINGIPKKIENYLSAEVMRRYFKKYILPILHIGNYYDIGSATNIINKNISKTQDKEGLREFLVCISKQNIDSAKGIYSEYLFRKYMKILAELEINPILIPKNCNRKFFENPLNPFFNEKLFD